jgi:hypothetical protein
LKRRTGVPQGVIACAHGGTSMQQWDPAKKDLGGNSLYGATLRRFHKNGSSVAGIAWYQGESDANDNDGPKYTQRMIDLIGSFRKDFNAPKLPWVTVQISRVVTMGEPAGWNSIQEQQRKLPKVIPNSQTVPGVDLMLDDLIHIGGPDNTTLGKRIAEQMDYLRRGNKAGLPPIEVKSVRAQRNPKSSAGEVIVEFVNVKGKLASKDYPSGFTLVDSNGGNAVYRVDLDGNKAILRTSLAEADVQLRAVHYGQGLNPFCNIRDEAGRSLPVFGPIAVGTARATTKYVTELQVSDLLPSAGKLESLAYPANMSALKLEARKFPGSFCDRHAELGARMPDDVLVYFRSAIEVSEPMDLMVYLGYDGPVKMWIDGTEHFFDPNGTNPANPADKAKVKYKASPGKHEVLVALSSNHGKAWGIFLHYERKDVPKKQLEEGPHAYVMPKIVMG